MSKRPTTSDLDTAIEQHERAIAKLRAAHEKATSEAQALQQELTKMQIALGHLRHSRAILLGEPEPEPIPPPPNPQSPRPSSGRPSIILDAVIAILTAHGKPLRLEAIITELANRNIHTSATSLEMQLGKHVKQNTIFTRTGPRTFGLRSWQEAATGARPGN